MNIGDGSSYNKLNATNYRIQLATSVTLDLFKYGNAERSCSVKSDY